MNTHGVTYHPIPLKPELRQLTGFLEEEITIKVTFTAILYNDANHVQQILCIVSTN